MSGIRLPVISCPFSSQPVHFSNPVQGEESAPGSLEWDNYSEETQFLLEPARAEQLEAAGVDAGTELAIKGVRKIPIVSTDCSELESLAGSFHIGVVQPVVDQQREQLEERWDLDTVFEEATARLDRACSATFSDSNMAQQITQGPECLKAGDS